MAADPPEPRSVGEDDEQELARLPGGRHGLPREFVIHNQRERLIAGLAEAVAEHGYAETTITHITTNAGVSRRTFYEHFADKEEAFLAAYDVIVEHLRHAILEAAAGRDSWPEQVVAGTDAALRFLAAEPELARLLTLESVVAGRAGAGRYRDSLYQAVPLLKPGREQRPGAYALPASTEEALIGGVASLVAREVNAGHAAELPQLLPEIATVLLLPYLGADEAGRLAEAAA